MNKVYLVVKKNGESFVCIARTKGLAIECIPEKRMCNLDPFNYEIKQIGYTDHETCLVLEGNDHKF